MKKKKKGKNEPSEVGRMVNVDECRARRGVGDGVSVLLE